MQNFSLQWESMSIKDNSTNYNDFVHNLIQLLNAAQIGHTAIWSTNIKSNKLLNYIHSCKPARITPQGNFPLNATLNLSDETWILCLHWFNLILKVNKVTFNALISWVYEMFQLVRIAKIKFWAFFCTNWLNNLMVISKSYGQPSS